MEAKHDLAPEDFADLPDSLEKSAQEQFNRDLPAFFVFCVIVGIIILSVFSYTIYRAFKLYPFFSTGVLAFFIFSIGAASIWVGKNNRP